MIIRSSFHDYYDRVTGSSSDPSVVYERETTQATFDSPFVSNDLPSYFPTGDHAFDDRTEYSLSISAEESPAQYCVFHVIGFCGEHVVCLTDGRADQAPFFDRVVFGEEILKLPWSQRGRHREPSAQDRVHACLERFHGMRNIELFRTFNVPTFATSIDPELTRYEQRNIGLYGSKITLNPRLADYDFMKYVDAYSAFTRIEDYISGVLGQPSPPTIEVSNDVKIAKAGFDDKTSFKKR